HQHDSGGAVVDARGIASRHRAVLLERRAQLGDGFVGGTLADVLVLGDDRLAFPGHDRYGSDLVLELARLLGSLGLVLRGDREPVLLLTGDLPLAGDVLGCRAHVVAVEGVPQAIFDHRVDELQVAHLGAFPQVRTVWRLAHAFLAAGEDDVGRAELNLLRPERNRPEARSAELVHAPGRAINGDAGRDRGLPRGVLTGAGREDLAHDDLVHIAGLDPCSINGSPDGYFAKLVRWQTCERAVERSHWRASGARDDDCRIVCAHYASPG